jgi:hypothetical protein
VFAVSDCGFRARCALEIDDSSQVRIEKIYKIIAACKYGIHDISRTDPSPATDLPRFNMPLELGLFLGAKRFGSRPQREKVCLILDSAPNRYQQFISDIAGQDIQAHRDDPKEIITAVRNWLRTASQRKTLPGGAEIHRRFLLFQHDMPRLCEGGKLERDELTFQDYTFLIANWLAEQAKASS